MMAKRQAEMIEELAGEIMTINHTCHARRIPMTGSYDYR